MDGVKHNVVVPQTFFERRRIAVDGNIVYRGGSSVLSAGTDAPFEIGKHQCAFRSAVFLRNSDLIVDGRSMNTRKLAPIISTPFWGWLFVLACLIIPVVVLVARLPYLIPYLVSVGGAVGCRTISMDTSRAKGRRIAMCFILTAICWLVFIGVSMGIGILI